MYLCMHVFENIHMCICINVYRHACRQRMSLEGGPTEKIHSRQHLRMSEERWRRMWAWKSAVEWRAVGQCGGQRWALLTVWKKRKTAGCKQHICTYSWGEKMIGKEEEIPKDNTEWILMFLSADWQTQDLSLPNSVFLLPLTLHLALCVLDHTSLHLILLCLEPSLHRPSPPGPLDVPVSSFSMV